MDKSKSYIENEPVYITPLNVISELKIGQCPFIIRIKTK